MLGQDHYIYRLRASCIAQPHLNRYQLAALDRELTLVRAAATPEEHLEASGYLIGLARATELDRAANALDIARRYDDPWSAAAAGIDFRHAQQGANHAELYTSIHAGHERAAALRAISTEIHAAFMRLFFSLLHVHTSNFELGPAHTEIAASFQILRQLDPSFVPGSWLDRPRFARRLPWRGEIVHGWLEPYWDEYPTTALPVPADPDPLPPAAPQGGEWPAAEPLDVPSPSGLAEVYLHRQNAWPDEVLAAHWQASREAIEAARSPIAQYAVAGDGEARFSIAATHNLLSLTALLAPLRAIANHGWQQTPESREGMEKANATVQALTGLTPNEIYALPRVQRFIEQNLKPRLEQGTEGFGALAGEGGFDFIRHAAMWHAQEPNSW